MTAVACTPGLNVINARLEPFDQNRKRQCGIRDPDLYRFPLGSVAAFDGRDWQFGGRAFGNKDRACAAFLQGRQILCVSEKGDVTFLRFIDGRNSLDDLIARVRNKLAAYEGGQL